MIYNDTKQNQRVYSTRVLFVERQTMHSLSQPGQHFEKNINSKYIIVLASL